MNYRTASLFFLLLIICAHVSIRAQVYYPITHLSGAQSIGNRTVTVTPVNSPPNGYSCVGPYAAGQAVNTGWMFTFSNPANYVIVEFTQIHTGEILSFYVNGSHYFLNSSMFSSSSCGPINTITVNSSGDIQGVGNVAVHFTNIIAIDSIRVMEPTWAGGGSLFSFQFGGDTTVSIKEPMQDTLLCSLDSIKLAFTTMGRFKSNNVFTAQLSNAAGSFATPINIGTRSADTTDTIKCQIPVNTPTGTGYKLRIISTNPVDTSDINIKNIAIGNAPPPSLNAAANTPVCSGSTLNLTANTTGSGYNWSWAGALSYTSNVQNPSIANSTVTQSGDYIVTGRLHGCIGKDTVTVTVNQSPAAITAGSNSAVCEGGTLSLTSTSGGAGATYSWTGPATYTAGVQNPSRVSTTTAHSGDYIVTATLNNCDAKDTVTVLVKPMPAVPTATNNGPLCPGDSLGMTASSTTAGVSYNWNGPASFGSGLQNPYVLNVNSGNGGVYNVTATLNGCTSSAGNTTVIVKPTPATPMAGSNTPICAGAPLNLTANGTAGSVYSWTGPNGFTSNQQNPAINPATLNNAGIYSVTATLNGCPSTGAGSTVVVVNNVSSIGAYPSPNDTICQLSPNASFVAVPNNGGSSPQYQWYKNGNLMTGAMGLTFPATGIANGDSFYCRMTVTGLCSAPLVLYSNKVGMTVLPPAPPATISITANPSTPLSPWQTVMFTATPGGNAGSNPTYQWKRNGSNIVGATSTTWSANNLSDNDEISCVITSSEWCTNPANVESNKIAVHIKTGINDVANTHYKVYPNPVANEMTIEGEAGMQVSILNVLGQEVYNGVIITVKDVINISQFVPGSYVVLLTGADGSRSVVKVTKR
ncbi:T9SS type A sorting domain-containing protein [Polluticoccus soli]|uniref:T9SS type A sorting domain-containing protein n=1 Tax=Polluticoccus soli TaxID=3034150 RepID=UPI0023E1E549|nr:T9SS type A sorting domain-containing protein [Flavipsychrobacter sp. JY13-12]